MLPGPRCGPSWQRRAAPTIATTLPCATSIGGSRARPSQARRIAGDLALLLQASLLLRTAPGVVADVFCATRLGERPYGVVGSDLNARQADAILALR
jgi:hypothetical protein